MLKVGISVVISKETGLPPLYGKKGKIMSCRYEDIAKNMKVLWQVQLNQPLELNGVIIREVWLPQEAIMETAPVAQTIKSWEDFV